MTLIDLGLLSLKQGLWLYKCNSILHMQSVESNLQSSNPSSADVRIAEGDHLQTTQYLTDPSGGWGGVGWWWWREMEQWIWGKKGR